MSALAALAALERELGARHRDCVRREGMNAQSSLALEAVIQAVRDAQPTIAQLALPQAVSDMPVHRAPVDVPCNAYVTRMIYCQRSYGHTGPCEFPTGMNALIPEDLRDGIGTLLRGVWHLNEKTYTKLREWETWGRQVAMPALRANVKEGSLLSETLLGRAIASRPKD